jgi:hypothetical protein
LRRWAWLPAVALAGAAACFLLWWNATAETRGLRALPDAQRLLFYHHTLDELKDVCDPAAPRSLHEFCQRQAELAAKFPECNANQECQELVRRHLSQPRR